MFGASIGTDMLWRQRTSASIDAGWFAAGCRVGWQAVHPVTMMPPKNPAPAALVVTCNVAVRSTDPFG